jgi:hypothetical protein
MPWNPNDAMKHTKKATGKKASAWSSVANSVLGKTGDEGKAVRIANSAIQRRMTKGK